MSISPVYLELGAKRVLACSLVWPGLARVAKNEEAALEALSAYVPRYAVVLQRARVPLDGLKGATWAVVQQVPTRSGAADLGVPAVALGSDEEQVGPAEAARTSALLKTAWELFDEVVASAPPSLRKGPRGGGRDRDAIADHVAAGEQMYAGRVGLKLHVPKPGASEVVRANRQALLEWCLSGQALPAGRAGWPPRYAARRILWHVLDHLWEIEDRREPI